MTLEERIRAIIAKNLCIKIESVVDSADLIEDLGADDLDIVAIVMDIEDEFELDISDEEAAKGKTVADLIRITKEGKNE